MTGSKQLNVLSQISERIIGGSDRQSMVWRLLLITLVGVAAYANTFTMAFNFDDNSNIFGANALRNMGSLRDLFSLRTMRSVGDISFALTYRVWGSAVIPFHVGNLLIHLTTAWLVAALVLVTCRAPFMLGATGELDAAGLRTARLGALLAGLLFVAHPIQSQAVTYLVQRYASLATLWYVAALVCYARARLEASLCRWLNVLVWGLSTLILILFAMRTKEIAFTLPLALALYEVCFFRGKRSWRLAAMGGMLALLAVIPYTLFGPSLFRNLGSIWESLRVQTAMSRTDYLLSQLPVIAKYLRLIVWPAGQSIEHMVVQYKSLWHAPVLAAAALLLTLLLAGCTLIWRGTRGAPLLRLIGFGIVWFFLTLTVESSIIPIVDLIFEHRVYLPFVGICLAVGPAAALLADRLRRPGLVLLIGSLLVLVLAVVTYQRNEVWRTPVTLWHDATIKAPYSSRAWNNLAYAYLREKRPGEALTPLLRSIELNPGPPDVWNNIGIALEQLGIYQGRFQRNYNMFRTSADLLQGQAAWFANAYNNLGLAYEYLRQPAAAIQAYETSFSYIPDFPAARFNLGLSALMLGNRQLAEEQYGRLLQLDPAFAAKLGRLLGH
jgi:tetratricopeptide (TPR) repeat protein